MGLASINFSNFCSNDSFWEQKILTLGIHTTILLLLFCVQVHRYYRTSGGSINKAMGEAVTGAAKNEAVRGAVKSSVKAGVSAAMEKDWENRQFTEG